MGAFLREGSFFVIVIKDKIFKKEQKIK